MSREFTDTMLEEAIREHILEKAERAAFKESTLLNGDTLLLLAIYLEVHRTNLLLEDLNAK